MNIRFSGVATIVATLIFLGAGCTAAKDTVNQHLSAVHSGNLEQAYTFVAKGAQSTLSLATFKKLVEDNPTLKNYSGSSFNSISTENDTATVKGSLKGTDGSSATAEYRLIEEGSVWKISDILINGQEPKIAPDPNAVLIVTGLNPFTKPEGLLVQENGDVVAPSSKIETIGWTIFFNRPLKIGDTMNFEVSKAGVTENIDTQRVVIEKDDESIGDSSFDISYNITKKGAAAFTMTAYTTPDEQQVQTTIQLK